LSDAEVIPTGDSSLLARPYGAVMDFRAWLRSHGDALVAGILAVAMTAEVWAWADRDRSLVVVAGLLTTVPLVLRRRSTLVMFLLVSTGVRALTEVAPGFDNDSLSLVLAVFVSLYALGRHTNGWEAWLGGGLLVVQTGLFVHSDVGFSRADPGDVAFAVGFLGAPWLAGLTLRLRRDRERLLGAENDRLRTMQAEHAARAVAEERSRIARELHDVVSHAISVTVLQARGARRNLDVDAVAVRRALDAIEVTNAAALGDMRRLLAVLRDTEPEAAADDYAPQPSLSHLDRLVDHVRRSGVPVTVEVVGDEQQLPPGVDLSAYRIVQEALTNVLKHAADARATVTLDYCADALTVTVVDDGIPGPLDVGDSNGHGLIGIRERVAVVGGEVEAGPRPEGGVRGRCRLPYALEMS